MRRCVGKPLLGTPEVETAGDLVRQRRIVINEAFKVDSRYAAVVQQHPERWFTEAGLVFGDPSSRKRALCA